MLFVTISELSWRKFETPRLSFECVMMKAELLIGFKVKSKKKGGGAYERARWWAGLLLVPVEAGSLRVRVNAWHIV